MSDGFDHAGTTYAVPPEVWHKAQKAGTVGLVLGVLVLAGSLVGYSAGGSGDGRTIALAGMVVGFLVAAYGAAAVVGSVRARRVGFALTVAPAGLVIDSGGSRTTIAWADIEHAETVVEGTNRLALEIRPTADARIAFPPRVGSRKPAMPQPCRAHPGNVRVFSLTLLGPRLAECLNDVEQYVPVRERAGQAAS
jgi:hypothetical protein